MCARWSRLALLLLVPWVAGCVSGPRVRLDTGEGPPIVYTPAAAEPPPVQVRQEEFVAAMTDLVLHTPLMLSVPRREGRVVFASWGGERDVLQQMLRRQCSSSEPEEGCLVLPEKAPPLASLERMRLALSFAMDSVWEGASVPLGELIDPVAFKVMVYTAMSTWLLTLMMPEPVTKGLAAVLTVYLVAYLGLGPVWAMVEAGWRLLEESERATTLEEVKRAGQRFGRVLGENGMRVFLLLATAAIGGQTGFVGRGPGLPGFRQAALASPARTRVSLEAAGQVRTVVLGSREWVVGLAPTAVASSAMGPGGGAPLKQGSLSGRPSRPGPKADDETRRGITRENESARVLADNGYHVDQNPTPRRNGKEPDYKIDGEYADCMAPSTSSARNIAGRIKKEKVERGQADRIILNLDDSTVTIDAMKKQLLDWPIPGLKQVIAIKDGKVILLFP
ncbi:MAG TPA: hypothetical protein VFZ09_26970 [Archangium sp.]|uniref:SitA5 family polymorphic toxin n=1 Tax=Archangium sp. TaxID=1872627 RepID=UPI002E345B39|nr:hypothetical protein [Archangium sp.]HEX5749903.1 hypothetical protein [Archangium sp.]